MKKIFKKIVAYPLAEACYWLGHLFSIPCNWNIWGELGEEENWKDKLFGCFYYPYQKFMIWSHNLSMWAELGIWKEVTDEELEEGDD